MFKHILVPIDLHHENRSALRMALALAQQNRARVSLLHVIYRVALAPDEMRAFYDRLLTISRRTLDRAAKPFATEGIDVATSVRIGEPVPEILRTAAKSNVDLIVMGSHTVDPARQTRGWGTISYRVGLLCACPVLLVKRQQEIVSVRPTPARSRHRRRRGRALDSDPARTGHRERLRSGSE
jgi:nucleotide-binding universal stress UspA family protein